LYFALHVLFVSHETFCFYQTVYIFIYSAYKLQVCSLNFCVLNEKADTLAREARYKHQATVAVDYKTIKSRHERAGN